MLEYRKKTPAKMSPNSHKRPNYTAPKPVNGKKAAKLERYEWAERAHANYAA
jgi:hypothetical protein